MKSSVVTTCIRSVPWSLHKARKGDAAGREKMIDMLGKIVFSKTFYNANNAEINTGALQKGLFLVRVTTDKNVVETQKLVIE